MFEYFIFPVRHQSLVLRFHASLHQALRGFKTCILSTRSEFLGQVGILFWYFVLLT